MDALLLLLAVGPLPRAELERAMATLRGTHPRGCRAVVARGIAKALLATQPLAIRGVPPHRTTSMVTLGPEWSGYWLRHCAPAMTHVRPRLATPAGRIQPAQVVIALRLLADLFGEEREPCLGRRWFALANDFDWSDGLIGRYRSRRELLRGPAQFQPATHLSGPTSWVGAIWRTPARGRHPIVYLDASATQAEVLVRLLPYLKTYAPMTVLLPPQAGTTRAAHWRRRLREIPNQGDGGNYARSTVERMGATKATGVDAIMAALYAVMDAAWLPHEWEHRVRTDAVRLILTT
jgi:hypothetical protein